ncbi:hypothetical protein [Lysobacter gummosus]|uniref:hypothetical protein n=1 Tax=Lysobacter gummosus TaxID=262324 RepID=UPI003625C4E4
MRAAIAKAIHQSATCGASSQCAMCIVFPAPKPGKFRSFRGPKRPACMRVRTVIVYCAVA